MFNLRTRDVCFVAVAFIQCAVCSRGRSHVCSLTVGVLAIRLGGRLAAARLGPNPRRLSYFIRSGVFPTWYALVGHRLGLVNCSFCLSKCCCVLFLILAMGEFRWGVLLRRNPAAPTGGRRPAAHTDLSRHCNLAPGTGVSPGLGQGNSP